MKKNLKIIIMLSLLLVGCQKEEEVTVETPVCSLDNEEVCYVDGEYLIEDGAEIYLGNLSLELQEAIINLWDQQNPTHAGLIKLNEDGELSEEEMISSFLKQDKIDIMYASEDLLTYYVDHLYKLDSNLNLVKTADYDIAIEDYFLPFTIDGIAFLANKTMLEEFGVDVSDNDGDGLIDAIDDWDKIFTLVARFSYDIPSFKNKEVYIYFPFCFNEETLSYFMMSAGFKWFATLEGDKPGFDSEEFKTALSFIYNAGKFPFAIHRRTEKVNGKNVVTYTPFTADEMVWSWERVYNYEISPLGIVTSWMNIEAAMSVNHDEFVVSRFPSYLGMDVTPLVTYQGFAIESDTAYPSAAQAVMQFLESQEVTQLVLDYSTKMPYTYGYELDYHDNLNRKQYTESLMKATHIPLLGLPDNMYEEAMGYYNEGEYLDILKNLYDHQINVEQAQKEFISSFNKWYTNATMPKSLDQEKK